MSLSKSKCWYHRYRKAKIDCLSFVMCPLLAQLIIAFFFLFFCCSLLQYYFSKQGRQYVPLSSLYILRCLWLVFKQLFTFFKAGCSIMINQLPVTVVQLSQQLTTNPKLEGSHPSTTWHRMRRTKNVL